MQSAFGLSRIIGELRKLGLRRISRQTVRNILKEEGIQPGPDRKSDCWDDFIKRHGETLWAADFFSVRTVTARGLRQMYVLVFLRVTTREIIVSESTEHPNSAWVSQQAETFVEETSNREQKPVILLHDRDTKFSREFVEKLKSHGVKANPLPPKSPNLNGRCERVIQTLQYECLRKFIIFGKQHLDHLLSEFTEYYNTTRSSMVRDSLPPIREAPEEIQTLPLDEVEVTSHLGGLVKSFKRRRRIVHLCLFGSGLTAQGRPSDSTNPDRSRRQTHAGPAQHFLRCSPPSNLMATHDLATETSVEQRANRRIGELALLQEETAAWSSDVNTTQRGVDWQMKIDDARCKLKSLYPKIKP